MDRSIVLLVLITMVLTTLAGVLVAAAAHPDTTAVRSPSSRLEVKTPVWENGDWWRYNRTMSINDAGQIVVYHVTINYTVTSTSVTDSGYSCYRLSYVNQFYTTGDADREGTFTGAKHIRRSDLSLIRDNYTETGMIDGSTPYSRYEDLDLRGPTDYYDYYQFPVEILPGSSWYVDTVSDMKVKEGLLGSFHLARFDNFNLSVEYVNGAYYTVPAGTFFCHELSGTDAKGQSSNWDKRQYSYGLKNYVQRDCRFTYNDSYILSCTERLEGTNVLITSGNSPPVLSDPRAIPATIPNDNNTQSRLSVEITDETGLAVDSPVTINLTELGHGSAVALTKESLTDRWYVYVTAGTGTTEGEHILPVCATDAEGLSNSTYIHLNVTDINANQPPRVSDPEADPEEVNNGGHGESILSAHVSDTNLRDVSVDLSSIGLNVTTPMKDDGSNGDPTSGDGRYSVRITVPSMTQVGGYHFPITATDDLDAVNDTVKIRLNITEYSETNTPPTIRNPAATPSSVVNDGTGTTLFTLKATDPDVGDVVTVEIDLTQVGTSDWTRMYDDGTHGDTSSGDNVFSYQYTVPNSVTAGTYTLPVRAYDINKEVVTDTIELSVFAQGGNQPPDIYTASASPSTVANDGLTPVLFEITVTDPNPTDAHTVSMDLMPIGGAADQELKDDGSNGDTVAGDSVFSMQTVVPASVPTGTKLLNILVTDNGTPRMNSTSTLELVVSANSIPVVTQIFLNPPSVAEGSNRTIMVQVSASDPEGDTMVVTVDLTAFGFSNRYPMKDDGSGGDPTANDGWFSASFTLPADVKADNYTLVVTVYDLPNSGAPVTISTVLEVTAGTHTSPDGSSTDGSASTGSDSGKQKSDMGLILPLVLIGAVFLLVAGVMLVLLRKKPVLSPVEEEMEEEEKSSMRLG